MVMHGDIEMVLHICDSHIDAMVSELQRLTKARTKTEVVRRALQHELARVCASLHLAPTIQQKAVKDAIESPD
jgi:antitoxin VapB